MRSVKNSPAPMRSVWPMRAAVLCLLLPAAQAETDPAAAAVPGMAASATSAPAALPTTPIAPPAPPSAVREQVPTEPVVVAPPAPVAPKAIAVAPPKPSAAALAARPAWTELTASQQQALGPLAGRWTEISEQQRRKWITLSQNFHKLPAPEQEKLHSRMTDWAALSVQQRNQARLNFAETNKLAPDDKKAQWEAYQALSAEEKQKLAAGATKKPAGAAIAIKPVAPQKMVVVPPKPVVTNDGNNTPASRTLLPQVPPAADARKL